MTSLSGPALATGIYLGIVILAATVVLLTIVYMKKSVLRKDASQVQEPPVEDVATRVTSEQRPTPQKKALKDRLAPGVKRANRLALRIMRIFKKRSAPPAPKLIIEGPTIDAGKRFSLKLPDVADSPATEVITEVITELPNQDQEVSSMKPANEEKPEAINTSPAEPAELPQEQSQEEAEPAEPTSEGADGASDNIDQKPPATEDALANIFAAEVEEDDGTSELAGNLEIVDAGDILAEARSLLDQFKGTRN